MGNQQRNRTTFGVLHVRKGLVHGYLVATAPWCYGHLSLSQGNVTKRPACPEGHVLKLNLLKTQPSGWIAHFRVAYRVAKSKPIVSLDPIFLPRALTDEI